MLDLIHSVSELRSNAINALTRHVFTPEINWRSATDSYDHIRNDRINKPHLNWRCRVKADDGKDFNYDRIVASRNNQARSKFLLPLTASINSTNDGPGDVLQTFYRGDNLYDLITYIRNTRVHWVQKMKNDARLIDSFSPGPNDNEQITNFVNYWTTRFPGLILVAYVFSCKNKRFSLSDALSSNCLMEDMVVTKDKIYTFNEDLCKTFNPDFSLEPEENPALGREDEIAWLNENSFYFAFLFILKIFGKSEKHLKNWEKH